MTHQHVEPMLSPLIKENQDGKSEKYSIKFKPHRHPTLSTSALYEFKMPLFDNGETEGFLFFYCYFNMNLAASGTL